MKKIMLAMVSLMVLCNASFAVNADTYQNSPCEENSLYNTVIQPYYTTIAKFKVYFYSDVFECQLETKTPCALRMNIMLYEKKGSGWSLLADKTHSRNGMALKGQVNCNFEKGKTYKAVVNVNAGGETDTIEEEYTF